MKLMLVCTSGGHFSTMRGLELFWSRHDRVWVTDRKKDTAWLESKEVVHWLPYQAPRDWLVFLINMPSTVKLLLKESPDIIVSTGASVAVNFAVVAKVLGVRYMYIESISRSQQLSLSGRIIYFLCDEFYVQWPELAERYPKAVFEGVVT